ncbi:MAG: hydrogenase [Euryarchaeota archaeon]|nr:hydrogenase [Euryarchaeota archaeon]
METHNNNNKDHKIAMVGTPCQILAATKMDALSDYTGGTPIDIKIGLFCMENFSYSFMKELLKEYEMDIKDVQEIRIEKNYLWFFLSEDRILKIPLEKAKSCVRKNCQICMDFTSELSDISVGSVGSPSGWSTVIIRTNKGKKLIEMAEKDSYIKTKPISESGLKIIEKLAKNKKNENKNEIRKRENIGRPVLYRREISEDEFEREISNCQFEDLKGDVVDVGACVLCGACIYTCPENVIEIKDRKPEFTGKCREDCNACYVACPRTFILEDILSKDLDKKPLGDFIEILSAKARIITGQDGGVVTALFSYVLSRNLVDDVIVVDKSSLEPWKPEAKLTDNVADVLKASGTKYAACPIFKSLKDSRESKSEKSKIIIEGGT